MYRSMGGGGYVPKIASRDGLTYICKRKFFDSDSVERSRVELRQIAQFKVYRRWPSQFTGSIGSDLCASNDFDSVCDITPDEAAIAAERIEGVYPRFAWATSIVM